MSTLFLKYRPKTFTDLAGQTSVVKTLQNAIKSDRPAHAYLFAGSRGTGKTSSARIFAKALNCEKIKEGNPCGTCKTCTDIAEGNLVDIIEIDAASNTGVDNIREIIEKIEFTPTYTKRKVYIIDEVHMLSKGAFNALLKTLEEPPEHVFFLLATTELHKIPETITSRCQSFIFHRFTIEKLAEKLKEIAKAEKFKAEEEALNLIAKKAEGGMRDAISLLEQIAAECENKITETATRESLGIASSQTLEDFWQAILTKDTETGLQILQNINQTGGDFRTFGHEFLGFLREKLHAHLDTPEELAKILPAIEEIEKALTRIKHSPIIELPLEIAIINLCTTLPETTIPQPTTPLLDGGSCPRPNRKKEQGINPSPAPTEPQETSDFILDEEKTEPSKPTKAKDKPTKKTSKTENLTEASITAKMKQIAEESGIPIFAKRSFLSTEPEVQENQITFQTDSDFHKDKLLPKEILIPLQDKICELFGDGIKIEIKKSDKPKKPKPTNTATAEDFLSF